MRDIAAGEEITLDYALFLADPDSASAAAIPQGGLR
jgi:SET domain-containing protein